MFFFNKRNNTRISVLTTSNQYYTLLAKKKYTRKGNKPIQIEREEEMLTLFTDKLTVDGIYKKYQFEPWLA